MAADPQPPSRRRRPHGGSRLALRAARLHLPESSEIYGGINGFWDYGPLGVELKNNLKALWWQRVVRERDDVEGLDSSIICHPRTWEASGHVEHFGDRWSTAGRARSASAPTSSTTSPPCTAREDASEHDLTAAARLQPDAEDLRRRLGGRRERRPTCAPRPARPIFTDFKRVREASRQKIPFGIAQIGKAFRNEINPRNFTFRSREFEQAELEFFCPPGRERRSGSSTGSAERIRSTASSASAEDRLRVRPHEPTSSRTTRRRPPTRVPVPVRLAGDRGRPRPRRLGPRRATREFSGKDLSVLDEETRERFMPTVIETSVGIDRTALALLCNAYAEEKLEDGETRVVLRLRSPLVAPIQAAVLPLSKKLAEPAQRIAARAAPALGASSTTRRATSAGATGARTRWDALLRHLRLRVRGGREGDRARPRHHAPGPRVARRTRGLPAGAPRPLSARKKAAQACFATKRRSVYFFGAGRADGKRRPEGAARRQGREPGRDDAARRAGAARLHDLHRGVRGLPAERRAHARGREARSARGARAGREASWARASATPSARCWSRCARARAPRCPA